MAKLFIIGTGPGNENLWTQHALDVLRDADTVLSTARIGACRRDVEIFAFPALLEKLQTPVPGTTAVLVSGDCGFYSATRRITHECSSLYDIEWVGGIGSVSYLSAKIMVPYDDAKLVSLHGRDMQIVPLVAYHPKIFALTGGTRRAHDVCETLDLAGLGGVNVIVGEKLSYPEERIVRGTAQTLRHETFDDLSVICIENEAATCPHLPIRDDVMIRGDVPMTKEETRWLVLQKLAIQPSDVLYDVGAGTGSVTVEMARKAFEGIVYAFEMNDAACELIEKNRVKHGAFNTVIVRAKAPDGFAKFPSPDKAFIGGSSGNMREIVATLVEKNPNIRIVATAISLQSLHRILESFAAHGIMDVETICVNIAKSRKLGGHDIMTAQNPVYIITGTRGAPCES